MKPTELPTKAQIGTALEVTRWYLTTHYGTEDEPGMPGMFCDRARIGELAIEREALKRGTADALFALLVTTAMFQRLQDRIVMGILRGIDQGSARRGAEGAPGIGANLSRLSSLSAELKHAMLPTGTAVGMKPLSQVPALS